MGNMKSDDIPNPLIIRVTLKPDGYRVITVDGVPGLCLAVQEHDLVRGLADVPFAIEALAKLNRNLEIMPDASDTSSRFDALMAAARKAIAEGDNIAAFGLCLLAAAHRLQSVISAAESLAETDCDRGKDA